MSDSAQHGPAHHRESLSEERERRHRRPCGKSSGQRESAGRSRERAGQEAHDGPPCKSDPERSSWPEQTKTHDHSDVRHAETHPRHRREPDPLLHKAENDAHGRQEARHSDRAGSHPGAHRGDVGDVSERPHRAPLPAMTKDERSPR